MSGRILRRKTKPLVSLLLQAYVGLLRAPESEDGSRTVSLARYGAFEVRLVEFRHCCTSDASPFWVELYRHDTQSSLDSYLSDDLEGAEVAAEQFTSHARVLELMLDTVRHRFKPPAPEAFVPVFSA
jgi:hypothetical protein